MIFGHKLRKDGAADRAVEGAHHADEDEDAVDQTDGTLGAQGYQQQQGGAQDMAAVTQHQHQAAIEAIHDVPGDQEEKNARKKLCETHQAEIERTLGDFVNLPAHRHRLHFQRENHAETRYLEEAKVWKAENRDALGPGIFDDGRMRLAEGLLGHLNYFATKLNIKCHAAKGRCNRRAISSTI